MIEQNNNFEALVAWINKHYHEQEHRGQAFEKAVKYYLENDKTETTAIGKVWLWNDDDNPCRDGGDTGIDLVAEDKNHTGKYVAIQAKFYDKNTTLTKTHLDSFMASSGKALYSRRIAITTASDITDNLSRQTQAEQNVAFDFLTYNQLNQSSINWQAYITGDKAQAQLPKKQARPHQETAIADVITAFQTDEITRGKLIMACGTGKTFTSLKIAEQFANSKQSGPKQSDSKQCVLFLVPSISLLSQTLREWCIETEQPITPFAVCSDANVGMNEDKIRATDLGYPVTTNPQKLAEHIHKQTRDNNNDNIIVIFSTYQSIDVIIEAQAKYGLPELRLIICDEAHRTTGVENKEGKDSAGKTNKESHFTRVHDNQKLRAQKRLYMTATPRIYAPKAKTRAQNMDVEIYSMDDEAIYGTELHRLDFSEAVENGLLTDYRVLIMAVDENYARSKFSSIATDDAAKIIGCWNGLRKYKLEIHDDIALDPITNLDEADDTTPDVSDFLKETLPMRRAVAFANTIEASQTVCDYFNQLSQENNAHHSLFNDIQGTPLNVQARHVDGTQSAFARDDALRWLRADASENNCRILTNARCLSEGVDVPALDAVMFLKPRKSEIDIVQAVGRVMRKAEGKEYGYIILPIPVKPEEDAAKALHHNDKYQVVWDVLQALRSHDDRFDIEINQMELNQKLSNKIQIIGIGEGDDNDGNGNAGKSTTAAQLEIQYEWEEKFLEYRDAIFAKLVLKCGDREYWENWSKDVAEIAQRNIARLQKLLDGSNPDIEVAFNVFISNMQKTINPAINKAEAIELLSQHFITKPVFDALFGDYQFAEANPISQGLDGVVQTLQWLDVNQGFTEDAKNLQRFYEAVRRQVKGVTTSDGIERIAITLYEKFFQKAFPKAAARMGVVYTPIEIVDYILHSANHALQNEFGKCLADKDIHIIDPFTGTGTFISRLLKNKELIPDDALAHKYSHELHANEILLLAYYLANVNIENAYHDRIKNPTDVDMNDSGGVVKGGTSQGSGLLPRDREAKPLPPYHNGNPSAPSLRHSREGGNPVNASKETLASYLPHPPYHNGNPSAPSLRHSREGGNPVNASKETLASYLPHSSYENDNIYANLQDKPDNSYTPFEGIVLCDTFQLYEDGGKDAMGISQENSERAKRQNNLPIKVIIGNPPYSAGQTNQNDNNQNLKYDRLDRAIENSYVKLGTATNKNSLYDSYIRSIRWASDKIKNHDGIICFVSNGGFINSNSADGLRKSLYGEFSKIYIYNLRGNIRKDMASRDKKEGGNVFTSGSTTGITVTLLIKNNKHHGECELYYHDIGDYLKTEDKLAKINAAKSYHNLTWQQIIPSLKGEWLNQASGDFENYLALGSKDKNYDRSTIFNLYSSGVKTGCDGWAINFSKTALQDNMSRMIDFYNQQCDAYHQQGAGQIIDNFIDNDATKISWSRQLKKDCVKNKQAKFYDDRIYVAQYRPFTKTAFYFDRQMNDMIYRQENIYPTRNAENIVLTVTGVGEAVNFSTIITNAVTNLHILSAGQAFPLYSYRSAEMAGDKAQPDEDEVQYDGQKFFRKCNITPEALQLFQNHYADTNISQEDIFYYCYGILHSKDYRAKYANDLKRELPHIPYAPEFKAFMQAGRDLAALHLNYENLPAYDGVTQTGTAAHKRVTKMKFANKADKSTIIYNECITISNIPLEAYDYVVNGKSAIEWVIDRYTTNPALAYKASGNKNNPNDYAPDNPDYILNLLQSVITLSMESIKIINQLPKSVEE